MQAKHAIPLFGVMAALWILLGVAYFRSSVYLGIHEVAECAAPKLPGEVDTLLPERECIKGKAYVTTEVTRGSRDVTVIKNFVLVNNTDFGAKFFITCVLRPDATVTPDVNDEAIMWQTTRRVINAHARRPTQLVMTTMYDNLSAKRYKNKFRLECNCLDSKHELGEDALELPPTK